MADDYLSVWEVLEEAGWVRLTDTRVEIIGDGIFYLPLIQNLLAHDRTEEMRKGKRRAAKDTSHAGAAAAVP